MHLIHFYRLLGHRVPPKVHRTMQNIYETLTKRKNISQLGQPGHGLPPGADMMVDEGNMRGHSAVRPVVFRHGQNWRAASCGGADLRGATSVSWRPQAPILRCCVRPEAGHRGEPCDCDCGEELCYPKHRRGLSDTCSTTIK